SVTGSMLTRGTTRYTREQLADEFDKLKASVGIGLAGATAQTTKPNFIPTLELIAHVLREPSFPQRELDQLRKQWIASLESDKSEPAALTGETLGKHFNTYERGDPRYYRSRAETIEDIDAVTIEQLRQAHRDFTGF